LRVRTLSEGAWLMAIQEKEREFKFTIDNFNFLRKLSSEYSDTQVSDERFDMFYSRLSKRVRTFESGNLKAYCHYLTDHPVTGKSRDS
jgi:chemotaxis protein methyltransferase CheR